MTIENTVDHTAATSAQPKDASAATNNSFLQEEAFGLAKEIKDGNFQDALKEVEGLRAGSSPAEFNKLLTSLNQDIQTDLKALGFPSADQIAFSDPDGAMIVAGGSHVISLHTAGGDQRANFNSAGQETWTVTDSDPGSGFNTETSTRLNPDTGLPISTDVIDQSSGTQTDYQYDKDGRVKSIDEYDRNGVHKVIDPETGKETLVSRTENFLQSLIKDEFGISF